MDYDNESKQKMLAELMHDMDISEVMNVYINNNHGYSRRLLRFFRWLSKWLPLIIMIAHVYGLWQFRQHPRELFVLQQGNTACYLFIYGMAYVLPSVLILSSRFFWLCWYYRIPFFYCLGVNAIHIAYGSIFTTNEMVESHECLLLMIAGLYIYCFANMFFKRNVIGQKICH